MQPAPPRKSPPLLASWDQVAYLLALLAGVAPLWAGAHLPLVDLPQHLHLISVLHRLHDPTTLYPQLFEARGELTPYLGYYYAVSTLNWLLPLELANKVFLSLYVIGMPLGVAFLLRSVKRPTWPSLLAIPFAYGDSFAWGFINYCASLPLTFLTLGLFVRALTDPPRRLRWAIGLGVSLAAVLLMHVQAFAYLGLALPFLLLTTRAPEDLRPARGGDGRFDALVRPRLAALLGVVPGVALFIAWFGGRLGKPAEIAPGQPWKAWGPIFSGQNLAFKGPLQHPAPLSEILPSHARANWNELPSILANMLRDGSDRWGVYAAAAVAGVGVLFWIFGVLQREPVERAEGPVERFRLVGLAAIALAMFLLMPFDIRGYVYYLNTRYAHLMAPLLLASVPVVAPRHRMLLTVIAAGVAWVVAVPLGRGFAEFNRELRPLQTVSAAAGPKPMVMGLVFNPGSRVVTHPVFLHSAAVVALEHGGAPNFSFASTPHSPVEYRGAPPPTFPSEWRPGDFDWKAQGWAYDHFLVRGPHPAQIFGALLDSELYVAAQDGSFYLVRRRGR